MRERSPFLISRARSYSFGKRSGNTDSAVNMQRALCPQAGTISDLCFAPYLSLTYLAYASPRASRVGPCAIAAQLVSKL